MPKVKVAQKDGEIVVTPGGNRDPKTYPVTDGQVTVGKEDVDFFLLHVDGAQVVSGAGEKSAGNPGAKET